MTQKGVQSGQHVSKIVQDSEKKACKNKNKKRLPPCSKKNTTRTATFNKVQLQDTKARRTARSAFNNIIYMTVVQNRVASRCKKMLPFTFCFTEPSRPFTDCGVFRRVFFNVFGHLQTSRFSCFCIVQKTCFFVFLGYVLFVFCAAHVFYVFGRRSPPAPTTLFMAFPLLRSNPTQPTSPSVAQALPGQAQRLG